jgi:putative DNA primase/helicase
MALNFAMQTAKDMWREVAALREAATGKKARGDEHDRVDYLTQHAVASGNIGKLKAMIEGAQAELRCEREQLDADPYLFYTPNQALRVHPAEKTVDRDREHLVTRLARTEYAGAACDKWEAFIAQTFPDTDLRSFVQRAVGYSMTGDMSEESFFMCWGRGRNGKGTFLRTIAHVLGTYAATIPIELLLEGSIKSGNEASPQYASLLGVRFVTTTEPSQGAKFNEGELKTLTGRDTIRIRAMYEAPFDMVPQFKLWIACNDRPNVRSSSDAYWRRVKLIPFVANISEGDTNKHLEEELRAEAPGILNWLLAGRADWAERGLAPPQAVTDANASYRDEMDPLQRFLVECLQLMPGTHLPSKRIYASYEGWCEENGENPLKQRGFGAAMTNKGYRRFHSNGTFYADVAFTVPGKEMEDARLAKTGKSWV